jgi:hypothetical protein
MLSEKQKPEGSSDHPLHMAVAEELQRRLSGHNSELKKDPACGGGQHLPLFIGPRRGRDSRICLVDLLVVSEGLVRVIVEIEESGFLPTKICGKFLQSALATHFVHDSQEDPVVPYADKVLFVQVLDSSKCLKKGTRKDSQAELIELRIRGMLPLKRSHITDYRLFFVDGKNDQCSLSLVGETVTNALTQQMESD